MANGSKIILIVANDDSYTYKLRKEILISLFELGHEVHVCVPIGKYRQKLESLGCIVHDIEFNGRSTNVFSELKVLYRYNGLLKKLKPNVVFTYTIKPNLYLSFLAKFYKTSVVPNITGLGTVSQNKYSKFISSIFYRFCFSKVNWILVQNEDNMTVLEEYISKKSNVILLPGSGINTEEFSFMEYPNDEELIRGLYIGRLIKDKGFYDLIESARNLQDTNIEFDILGRIPEGFDSNNLPKNIVLHGQLDDVRPYIKSSSFLVHPSYHEGMANAMLEACSSGRPVIASNIPGCIEIFEEGVGGFSFEAGNIASIEKSIRKFIELSYNERVEMGKRARLKVVNDFERTIVVDRYIDILNKEII